jgi:hypothetical protein
VTDDLEQKLEELSVENTDAKRTPASGMMPSYWRIAVTAGKLQGVGKARRYGDAMALALADLEERIAQDCIGANAAP